MKPTDAAWMAGLFDGEGCIIFQAVNSVELVLQMNDKDLIDRLQQVAECGSVSPRCREGVKDSWVWQCSRKPDVSRLLWAMLPWLGDRRGLKALQALERLAFARDQGTAQVCGKGHLKVGDNLYVDPTRGWSQCKICRRANARAGYKRLKEGANA